jgi:hypothetical protein
VESVEKAIDCFLSADPYSRTKAFDGKRIECIDGGWRLLNHRKYREIRDEEDRREKNAEAQSRFRSKQSKPVSATSNPPSSTVSHGHHNAEAEAEADTTNLYGVVEQLRGRLCRLYGRKREMFTYIEEEAALLVARRPDVISELAEIEAHKNTSQYAPRSIHSLLDSWDKTLDQSRNKPLQEPAKRSLAQKIIEEA